MFPTHWCVSLPEVRWELSQIITAGTSPHLPASLAGLLALLVAVREFTQADPLDFPVLCCCTAAEGGRWCGEPRGVHWSGKDWCGEKCLYLPRRL